MRTRDTCSISANEIMYYLCQRPWDEKVFERKVGRVSIIASNEGIPFQSVHRLLSYAIQEGYEHLVSRIDTCKIQYISEFQTCGFRIYGTLLSFQLKNYEDVAKPVEPLAFLELEELPQLQKWVSSLYQYSYMYKDPFFCKEKVDKLHSIWLENLFNDPDVAILVSRDGHGVCQGFVTLRDQRDQFVIDLLGVRPDVQGQGIAKRLLSMAIHWIQEQGRDLPLFVKTQGENMRAVNAYIASGFRVVRNELTFCHTLQPSEQSLEVIS